jgi:hypothetical protein
MNGAGHLVIEARRRPSAACSTRRTG